MTDVHEPEVRSYNMSQIKAKNTKPEILVRKFLHRNGFRYSLHSKKLPGKPDIVLKKYHTAIFVHGCFWHGHEGCKYLVIPKTRKDWWIEKISKNRGRDTANIEILKKAGWSCIVVWECELKNQKLNDSLYLIRNQLLNALS